MQRRDERCLLSVDPQLFVSQKGDYILCTPFLLPSTLPFPPPFLLSLLPLPPLPPPFFPSLLYLLPSSLHYRIPTSIFGEVIQLEMYLRNALQHWREGITVSNLSEGGGREEGVQKVRLVHSQRLH